MVMLLQSPERELSQLAARGVTEKTRIILLMVWLAKRCGLGQTALRYCPPLIFCFNLVMAEPSTPRRSGPPHNPGVRELVSDKRQSSSPPTRDEAIDGFRGWHERGYLPHRDQPGLTQFITYHLADAFPAGLLSEWEALLKYA